MLLFIALGLGLLGIVLSLAGVTENPALAKFVAGMFLIDAATAVAAAWARQR